ncbi:DNA topoisomerase IV subunit B [Rodentibacter pneumotropicus]|uniref:DNA topoisomerase (ATP-hydrolyzing) n=1 Tax=Rodentibacter pneumotropicus TaxID=758 RepID=A0A448MRH6_9PAST|nr:DNA topoisomerase IV subunit B [Rodentibacter pneumotropicus]
MNNLKMTTQYSAQEITVLKDLEPVQIRPGMYTDTTRPNHLAQEVIDNSVDEALAGFATKIEVICTQINLLKLLITVGECR